MLLCQKCLTKYTDKYMKAGKASCPVLGCGGNIIDVPEFLVEAVINFNKKGFVTKFISSPNLNKESKFEMYIIFDKIEKDKIQNSIYKKWKLPKGLKLNFAAMRMTNNREEDDKFVCPRLTTEESDNEIGLLEKLDLLSKYSKLFFEFSEQVEEVKE